MSMQGSEIVFRLLTHYCFFPSSSINRLYFFIVTSVEKPIEMRLSEIKMLAQRSYVVTFE